jgi:thiol:disulfide interchange protein DsbD
MSSSRGAGIALLLAILAILAAGPAGPAGAQTAARWSMTVPTGTKIEAGAAFDVRVTAEIDPGWHLYAMTQTAGGPVALFFASANDSPFRLAGNIIGPLPVTGFDPNFGIETQYHEERADFAVPFAVAADASGRQALALDVSYQTCTDRFCLPVATERLSLALAVGGTVDADLTSDAAGAAAPAAAAARAAVPDMAAGTGAGTLPAYIGLAALMGLLSLLTPCVFPMVPITVSYFTSRAERRRSRAALQAGVYGLGIVLTFTAVGFVLAAGFGASGINRLAADPWLNLGITLLFLAFALNLFGVYELALPARLLNLATRADEGRGRYAGSLLMGLAFTLTSFTCTAPFLGTLLVVAAQGDWQWPLAGMLAFSSVFALPFVGLALAPQLLAALPRSGGWLVSLMATMGLLELAAALKFISNADLVWGWGLFTRNVVIAAWVLIGLALAAYSAGLLPLGRAPRLGRPGPARMAGTVAVLAGTAWLALGLGGRRLGEVEAFLPPADVTGAGDGEPAWIVNEYEAALAQAQREARPVLVDFTGYTCTNCRWMEANMFPRPEVAAEMERYIRLRLYTDGRGQPYQRFQALQRDVFGTVALPYYAVLEPDGRPVVAFGGLTRDSRAFVSFLRRGLE